MYEGRHAPLASRRRFVQRVVNHSGVAIGLIVVSLGVGMVGYHFLQRMEWIDAFLNAAMLLGGMGPIETKLSWGTKLFAGVYALYAGLVVLVAAGILMAPIFHRFLHRFHLEEEEKRVRPR